MGGGTIVLRNSRRYYAGAVATAVVLLGAVVGLAVIAAAMEPPADVPDWVGVVCVGAVVLASAGGVAWFGVDSLRALRDRSPQVVIDAGGLRSRLDAPGWAVQWPEVAAVDVEVSRRRYWYHLWLRESVYSAVLRLRLRSGDEVRVELEGLDHPWQAVVAWVRERVPGAAEPLSWPTDLRKNELPGSG